MGALFAGVGCGVRYAMLYLGVSLGICIQSAGVVVPTYDPANIKVAFIYNFTKFVQWPTETLNSEQTFPICIFGDTSYAQAAQVLDSKNVFDLPISVKLNPEQSTISGCRVAFISASFGKAEAVLQTAASYPILTIVENSEGGMVNIFERDNKVRFNADMLKAGAVGLGFSARILQLAEKVTR